MMFCDGAGLWEERQADSIRRRVLAGLGVSDGELAWLLARGAVEGGE